MRNSGLSRLGLSIEILAGFAILYMRLNDQNFSAQQIVLFVVAAIAIGLHIFG